MTIRVQCPTGCEFSVADHRQGARVRCPHCQLMVTVRGERSVTISPPPQTPRPAEEVVPAEQVVSTAAPVVINRPERENRDDRAVVDNDDQRWRKRYQQSLAGRSLSCRVLAIFLLCLAALQMVPVFLDAGPNGESPWMNRLPHWYFLQCLAALWYAGLAGLLWQVHDWSALRGVTAVLLLAAVFNAGWIGLFSMDTTSGPANYASWFRELTARQVVLWSAAMMCLQLVWGYFAFREAQTWKRSEQLLSELLPTTKAEIGGNR